MLQKSMEDLSDALDAFQWWNKQSHIVDAASSFDEGTEE